MNIFGILFISILASQGWVEGRTIEPDNGGQEDLRDEVLELKRRSSRLVLLSEFPAQLLTVANDVVRLPGVFRESHQLCDNKLQEKYETVKDTVDVNDFIESKVARDFVLNCALQQGGLSKDCKLDGSFRQFDEFVRNLIKSFAGVENDIVDSLKSFVNCYDVPNHGECNSPVIFFTCFKKNTKHLFEKSKEIYV